MDNIDQDFPELKEIGDKLIQLKTDCFRTEGEHVRLGKLSLNTAIEIGKLLCEAKELIKHGNWEHWSTVKMQVSIQTIRKYRKLANPNYSLLLEKCKNLTEAYRKIEEMEVRESCGVYAIPKKSPKDLSKSQNEDDEKEYQNRQVKVRKEIEEVIKELIKDYPINWNVSQWSNNENGKLTDGKQLMAPMLSKFIDFVRSQSYKSQLLRDDEIGHKVGTFLSIIFNEIVGARPIADSQIILPVEEPTNEEKITELLKTINPFPRIPVEVKETMAA